MHDYAMGNRVYVEMTGIYHKLDYNKQGPYRITKVFTNGTVRVQRGQVDGQINIILLGIVAKLEGKMVLWSAQISEYVKARTMPLNWRKERSHGRLGAKLTLLGKM